MDFTLSSSLLIHIGAVFYIAGFMIRDELLLRVLVLVGTAFYLLYYFMFPETPLWDAIITSVILSIANLWVLFRIILERSAFGLSEDEKSLYEAFETFSHGQFRRVLKAAAWHVSDGDDVLTRFGEPPEHLYYIFEGPVHADKAGKDFVIGARSFVGEIAYALHVHGPRPASATVTAPKGTRYVSWEPEELRKLAHKSLALENALTALLSRDLAEKLGSSVQQA